MSWGFIGLAIGSLTAYYFMVVKSTLIRISKEGMEERKEMDIYELDDDP
jgi:hypothetical protein